MSTSSIDHHQDMVVAMAPAAASKRSAEGVGGTATATASNRSYKKLKTSMELQANREKRLEQNRRAARASRDRKKVMVEELQRSVLFFSGANASLRQQNDELERLLVEGQLKVAAIEQRAQEQQPQGASPATVDSSSSVVNHQQQRGCLDVAVPQDDKLPATANTSSLAVEQKSCMFSREASSPDAAAAAYAAIAMFAKLSAAPSLPAAAAPTTAAALLQNMKPSNTMQVKSDFQHATSLAMQMAARNCDPGTAEPKAADCSINNNNNITAAAVASMQAEYLAALALQQAAALRFFQPYLAAQAVALQQHYQQQQHYQEKQQQQQMQNKES